jgi:UDP:flavonoid glycosyltransferase YjiC (YdhE family)
MLPGHVVPFLDIIKTLVRGGHEAFVYGDDNALRMLGQMRCQRLRSTFGAATRTLVRQSTRRDLVHVAAEFANASGEDVGREIDRHRIDVALVDQMNPGAALAAASRQIPWASLAIGPALLNPAFDDWPSRIPLGRLRRRLGLSSSAPDSLRAGVSPYLHLLPWIPELDLWTPPLQSLHIGVPHRAREQASLVTKRALRWLRVAPRSRRVLVSVSTSPTPTLLPKLRGFFRSLRTALSALETRAVLTVPGGITSPTLRKGEAAHLRFERFIEHGALLPHVGLVIHHGGWGTLSKALAQGVPALIAPFERDQFVNATLCVRRGLALAVLAESTSSDTLCEGISVLLNSKRFASSARTIARRFRAAGGASAAASAVLRLGERS